MPCSVCGDKLTYSDYGDYCETCDMHNETPEERMVNAVADVLTNAGRKFIEDKYNN